MFFFLSPWKQELEFSRALGTGRGAGAVWEARTEGFWNFPDVQRQGAKDPEGKGGPGARDRDPSPGHSLLCVLGWRHPLVLSEPQCPHLSRE